VSAIGPVRAMLMSPMQMGNEVKRVYSMRLGGKL
jgi:hypothetical protein